MAKMSDGNQVTNFNGVDTSVGYYVGGTQVIDENGKVQSATLNDSDIHYAEVSLTAAQVKALRAAPATIVAAPGAGKMIEFLSAELILDYATAGFTESTCNLAFKLKDGSGVAVSETIETTGFIDQTADTITNAISKKDTILTKAQAENVPLVLHNTGGSEFGGATAASVLRIKAAYRIHTTGL